MFVASLIASCLMLSCSATPPSQNTQSLSEQTEDSTIGDRGAMFSRERMSLKWERQVGIRRCFLSDTRTSQLEALGWKFVRCDQDYAVAATEDRIGLADKERAVRQAAELTIVPQKKMSNIIERMRLRGQEGITGEIKTVITRRFNVSPQRSKVFVTGLVDTSATVHGTVSVALGTTNVCEFNSPDMLYPQTECYLLAGQTIIGIRTNSKDFEAIQGMLSLVGQLAWSD